MSFSKLKEKMLSQANEISQAMILHSWSCQKDYDTCDEMEVLGKYAGQKDYGHIHHTPRIQLVEYSKGPTNGTGMRCQARRSWIIVHGQLPMVRANDPIRNWCRQLTSLLADSCKSNPFLWGVLNEK